jgi:hypothetical protein
MPYTLFTDNVPPVNDRRTYPFSSMEAGQMVQFDLPNDMKKINRAAHQIGSNKGWRFAVRRQPDGSIRVWRLC